MAELKTTYLDDVLDVSSNERRKYQMITNNDGTVSFVDVTDYTQVGDSFGAKDINSTNGAINDLFNTKQNLLNIGTFSGNIDLIGKDGGLPSTSSVCCLEDSASGTIPSALGLSVIGKKFLTTHIVDSENAMQIISYFAIKKTMDATQQYYNYTRTLEDGTWRDWEIIPNRNDVVSSVSVEGTTVTAKNRNGDTLFTFTTQDTNTWRGIQNNLTSTSTTDSLSAYQGYLLNQKATSPILQRSVELSSKTIDSGEKGEWSVTPPTVSGYKPLTIISWNVHVQLSVCRCTLYNFNVKNTSSSSVTAAPIVYILYYRIS